MQAKASNVKPINTPSIFSKIASKLKIPEIPAFSPTGIYTWFVQKRAASKIILGTAFCILALCIFCYQPAKVYYTQIRNTARSEAELSAVQARNEVLSKSVESLKTNEGIEDKAITEFGYVKDGEGTAIVSGLEEKDTGTSIPAYVNSDSIKAPEEWYSAALDRIFGYDN